jgi:hypothetical protein
MCATLGTPGKCRLRVYGFDTTVRFSYGILYVSVFQLMCGSHLGASLSQYNVSVSPHFINPPVFVASQFKR